MAELVEAVARALGEKLNEQTALTKAEQDEALDLARVALAAIEAEGPTEVMIEAGLDEMWRHNIMEPIEDELRIAVSAIFRRMMALAAP